MARSRVDVYDIVTERIIKLLEKGEIPWRRPWAGGEPPQNLQSRKPYRGLNVWMLSAMSYASPYWLTFKQAKSMGGSVRKGSKATPIVFWNWIERPDPDAPGRMKKIPFLRYYSGFNAEQCEGIEYPKPEARDFQPIQRAERLIADLREAPMIVHDEPRAFYHPTRDVVNMPKPESFGSDEFYYHILFHELTHWTGHKSRLNREGVSKGVGMFGRHVYSKEELVAEMGSSYLSNLAGIEAKETLENSAAYIQGWLRGLRDDKRMIVYAAAQAQKAVDWMIGPAVDAEAVA